MERDLQKIAEKPVAPKKHLFKNQGKSRKQHVLCTLKVEAALSNSFLLDPPRSYGAPRFPSTLFSIFSCICQDAIIVFVDTSMYFVIIYSQTQLSRPNDIIHLGRRVFISITIHTYNVHTNILFTSSISCKAKLCQILWSVIYSLLAFVLHTHRHKFCPV